MSRRNMISQKYQSLQRSPGDGAAVRVPKTLALFMTKICDFSF